MGDTRAFFHAHRACDRLRALMRGHTSRVEVRDAVADDLRTAIEVHERWRDGAGWPGGVSDGLTLPCGACGELPRFDYQVSDHLWRSVVPEGLQAGVVCLPCLGELAGPTLAEHLREVQYTGRSFTVVLRPTLVHRYAPHTPNESASNAALATTEPEANGP